MDSATTDCASRSAAALVKARIFPGLVVTEDSCQEDKCSREPRGQAGIFYQDVLRIPSGVDGLGGYALGWLAGGLARQP